MLLYALSSGSYPLGWGMGYPFGNALILSSHTARRHATRAHARQTLGVTRPCGCLRCIFFAVVNAQITQAGQLLDGPRL
ncbi:hypothetical protein CBI36_02980 [Acetobacter oryzifermentans]|uniref:Uncharacterized protein n=2 Tax=Acetobacter TaxID=434 RepID=A0AAN1U9L4_9PROT|nr:hypothetical protein WG31_03115 [Acetobacter oryzifermentans]ASL39515.1 hypothetical protein CBI36_02980 [Acetobacter oryzifermentans]AXN01056.1 hypothetical protein CJF59_11220 [Acetobacter pomorum]